MTLLHLILWALYPAQPVLWLKATLSGFIAVLVRTLQDEDTLAWLEENPKHPKGLRLIEGSVALIETLIQALIYHRARELVGLPAFQMRRPSRHPPAVLAGSPRPLAEILLRFERALWVLRSHEHFASKRAARLAQLIEQRSLQLETVHHPLEATPPTTSLSASFEAAATTTILSCRSASGERIRAPP